MLFRAGSSVPLPFLSPVEFSRDLRRTCESAQETYWLL